MAHAHSTATRRSQMIAGARLSLWIAATSAQLSLESVAASPDVGPFLPDFFVSPRGNDSWSGKLADPGENDGPFATVQHARDSVRALLKTQQEPRPVTVVLRDG